MFIAGLFTARVEKTNCYSRMLEKSLTLGRDDLGITTKELEQLGLCDLNR